MRRMNQSRSRQRDARPARFERPSLFAPDPRVTALRTRSIAPGGAASGATSIARAAGGTAPRARHRQTRRHRVTPRGTAPDRAAPRRTARHRATPRVTALRPRGRAAHEEVLVPLIHSIQHRPACGDVY